MESDHFDLDTDDFDIIIVGAGLTGLTAAYNILKKHCGLSLLIIERQEAVGGRLQYSDIGFYIHSFQHHIFDLVEELNLSTQPSLRNDHQGQLLITKNDPSETKSWSIITCEVYYFIKSLQEASKECRFTNYTSNKVDLENIANMSVDEYIRQTVILPSARLICYSFIYAMCGVNNLTNVSCLWFFMMLNKAGGVFQRLRLSLNANTRQFIKGGMIEIIKRLESRILEEGGVIQSSENVQSIRSDDFRVFVTTSVKIYKSSYLIISVPPHESWRIIDETISMKKARKSLEYYYSEPTVYFEATYRSSFWTSEQSETVLTTIDSGSILKMAYNASHDENQSLRLLAGFIYDTEDVLNTCQDFNNYFSLSETHNCQEFHSRREENGVMSVLKPCALEHHENPLLMPASRIYFAISEYARHYPGTADGAVEAGENVASLVLHHVRPQVLDTRQVVKYIPHKYPPSCPSYCELDWASGVFLITNVLILGTFLKRAYFP